MNPLSSPFSPLPDRLRLALYSPRLLPAYFKAAVSWYKIIWRDRVDQAILSELNFTDRYGLTIQVSGFEL